MFKVVLEPAADVIGNIGFWDKTWRDQLVYETGWMISPEYQGRGFASKALAMLLGRLRGDHARRLLHAFPSITNAPSNALCRKLAFTNLGEVEFEYPPRKSSAVQRLAPRPVARPESTRAGGSRSQEVAGWGPQMGSPDGFEPLVPLHVQALARGVGQAS